MTQDAQWLKIDYRTLFVLTPDGRIERENDPDRSPGPRFWLAGCAEGNVFGVRADVPDEIGAEMGALAAREPPFTDPAIPPRYFDRYVALLTRHAPVTRCNFILMYELPHSLRYESDARLVGSDSAEGQALARSLSERGMPEGLTRLGFHRVADLWPPWCAAVIDGQIASIAFAARSSAVGAELGVVTVETCRGRGFAAAAAAGWSSLPSLRERTLFYSTDRENTSSQRVARRLGLRRKAASMRML
jgi:hypothetical protein